MLPQASRSVHQLGSEFHEVPPTRGLHPISEGGQAEHLVAEVGAVQRVQLPREQSHVVLRQPQRLPEVLDDALHRVGGNGSGEHGELRSEVFVHPPDEVVAYRPREVQVNIGEHGHVLRDEPLQRQVPPEGIDMADADEVPHQQSDRGATPSARWAFFQGCLRVCQPLLLHDGLGEQHNLPIEEQESREPVLAYQPELLVQTLPDLRGDGPVAPLGRFDAEPFEEALRGIPLRHLRFRQGVAEVGAEVEGALLRDAVRVGDGIGALPEEPRHPAVRLQVQVVVGSDEGERPVNGGVPARGHQRVLQPVALRSVVVDVVRGNDRHAEVVGQPRQFTVAPRVPQQKVLLQFHVDRVVSVPREVAVEQFAGIPMPSVQRQLDQRSIPATGEEHQTLGMLAKVRGVQPRLPAVDGIGQGEQPGEVAITLPRPGQQHETGAVRQSDLPAGDGLHAEAARQTGELQRSAEVGVG